MADSTRRATPTRRAIMIGNSDGIGLAVTQRLLADGWAVRGFSRSPSPLRHPEYRHTVVEVTAPEYRDRLAAALPEGDRIDLCVYSAGIGEPVDLTDLAAQTRVLEVNLIGAARTVEVVVPRMVAAGGGHLIGLSSLADLLITGQSAGYAASKAGFTSYFLGLSRALRGHRVAVTTIRFGFVDTKMAKGTRRPAMISAERAAEIVLRSLRRRPAVVSYPFRMAFLIRCLRAVTAIQLRIQSLTSR